MRVTTVNVNGIRAAVRKGMQEWVTENNPDVLLLQEVRAPEDLVADLLPGEWNVIQQSSRLKGRAGVAIAVRPHIDVTAARLGLDGDTDVDSGRWVEADITVDGTALTVISAYLHSGVATDAEKMAAKYRHLDMVTSRLADIEGEFLMAGDFNIVRSPADIKNFKPNHNKTSGVLDREIAYLTQWFSTYVDVHRALVGDIQGPYTWWSQRGKAFDNDAGWRIDYQMASRALAATAVSASVGRAADYASRWSDHAPLTIDYDLS
ncbi:exodeoxyribonuclease III [Flaviflexus equikiangi]|uniref:Endonuclease/exonuclease/phosphatase family protein n=1 Tax=Flaviflexus equikiangi TaxID=2758573 RepID=A0ABS2TE66_9ACTO|nr:exodeoxyribonuclease III [Flaviflexus equikiangi]MBM9432951.1 endonuclease/exonuclease/phosphatase family protein [Flaviflexus equikiangi]